MRGGRMETRLGGELLEIDRLGVSGKRVEQGKMSAEDRNGMLERFVPSDDLAKACTGAALVVFLSRAAEFGGRYPISVIGTFLVMWLLGRTINVISLAGLAFAIGMVILAGLVLALHSYQGRRRMRKEWVAKHKAKVKLLASSASLL